MKAGGQVWPGQLRQSTEFYDSLIERGMPIDAQAYRALRYSALAMDVYTFFAHRLHRIDGSITLSWQQLRDESKNGTVIRKGLAAAAGAAPQTDRTGTVGGALPVGAVGVELGLQGESDDRQGTASRGGDGVDQAGLAQLLADLDQLAGQLAPAPAFLDLGTGFGKAVGGEGAGGLLAIHIADEQVIEAVPGVAVALAAASGLATTHVGFAERTGAQVADGGDFAADLIASLPQGGSVVWNWHGKDNSPLLAKPCLTGSAKSHPSQNGDVQPHPGPSLIRAPS